MPNIPETLPMVAVAGGLLERIVTNIDENPFKSSPEGRPVLVSAGSLHAEEHIFEPIQQLGDALRGAGVGLGLAVARVSPMRYWPPSPPRPPGGGLTMVLTLPCTTTGPQASPADREAA